MAGIKTAGLIDGIQEHYLDHIAPLTALLNIPLILTCPKLEFLASGTG